MNHLGLFAKFWQPGTVKTRLAASIGDVSACEIYRKFLFHLLAKHQTSGDDRTVVFAPVERRGEFRDCIPASWNIAPQSEGDLGQRMQSFFESQFIQTVGQQTQPVNEDLTLDDDGRAVSGNEVQKVVVIGADCPNLSARTIDSAFELLDEVSVVIGPSEDGGYYLIGMSESCADIFSNIQWSTSSVFDQTIEQLESQNIKYKVLEPLNDIDELEDLVGFASQLEGLEPSLDASEKQLLEQVQVAISHDKSKSNADAPPQIPDSSLEPGK